MIGSMHALLLAVTLEAWWQCGGKAHHLCRAWMVTPDLCCLCRVRMRRVMGGLRPGAS